MKDIVFRVDDRLIHGQVVEGWIKSLRIGRVIIVNDHVSSDTMQKTIYKSVVPPKTRVIFFTLSDFIGLWYDLRCERGKTLVLFSAISDLMQCRELINEDIYINIGCVASREHKIKISDTVYLEPQELCELIQLSCKWDVQVKKLPWEKGAALTNLR